ncbi:MAG TPA: LysE family translocator [Gemmatimonadaceae bacterium]|nr:LysE family translocator [Gemmatimonadaceae bacterium]
MPTLSTLLVFMAAGLALNLTPGPDMLYVIARSAGGGRRAGIVSALGIATGTLVHITLVAAGLAGVLRTVPLAFDVVKYTGAAYLVYLGVRALMSREHVAHAASLPPASLAVLYRQGIVTNVLNPKVALFFLALLPQFVDPTRGPIAPQIVLLGMLFNTSGTLVNCAVAAGTGALSGWARERARGVTALRRLIGLVFIGIGARLAFARAR